MSFLDGKKNILEIPPKIRKKINDSLDERGKWREFASVVEGKQFTLRSTDIEKVAQAIQRHPSSGNSPSDDLLKLYSGRGMKVDQLIENLEKLKLENILVHLKAPEQLKIVKQPESVKVDRGKRSRFRCRATGFPYPRYRWLVVNSDGDIVEVEHGDKPELEFEKTRKSHEGCYICQVYNANTLKANKRGENLDNLLLESKRVQLHVVGEGPDSESDDDYKTELKQEYMQSPNIAANETSGPVLKITQHPSDVVVEELQDIWLTCKGEGTPPLEYQWYHNGNKIKDGGTKSVLRIISSLSSSHCGEYCCSVYNGKQLDSKKAMVTVIEAECNPYEEVEIIRFPEHKFVVENEEVVFRIVFRSRKENISCDWLYVNKFDSVQKLPVSIDDQRSVNLYRNVNTYTSTLQISNCKFDHEGRYFCQINEIVNGSPKQRKQSKSVTLKLRGSSATVENPSFKIALFIGVGKFKSQIPLSSVEYDIKSTASYFEEMGFKVISLLDLTLQEMKKAVDMFCKFVGPRVYVTLYFVSHGFLHQGHQYLMPWDAPTGPELKDFLCLEEVLHQIQNCKPLFILMIVDMCRIAPNDNDKLGKTTTETKTYKPDGHVNLVTCYAASKYEQAYEQEMVPEGCDQKGIFSRIFCSVLKQHKTKPVIQLFSNCISEKYREYLADEGKFYPMHPEIVVNCLNPNIRLTDPIERREGEEIEREKKLQQFNSLDKLPGALNIQFGTQLLELRFERRFSNAMVILLHTEGQPPLKQISLEIGIGCGLTVEWETNRVNEWRFIIRNLQRLQGELKPVLHIKYCNENNEQFTVPANLSQIHHINRPLISNSSVWQPVTTLKRTPTEDEEPPCSLEDLNI